MSAPTVKLICADDWHGLYVNGSLAYEGHSIPEDEWIDILRNNGIIADRIEITASDPDGFFLPQNFSDLKVPLAEGG